MCPEAKFLAALLVEGTQAGGVEVLLEDSVLLTEVHGVDLVSHVSPFVNELFRGIHSPYPSHSRLVSSSLTDD